MCRRDDEGRRDDADALDKLLLVRGCAHEVSGFEILNVAPRHSRRAADDGTDQDRRCRPDWAVRAQERLGQESRCQDRGRGWPRRKRFLTHIGS